MNHSIGVDPKVLKKFDIFMQEHEQIKQAMSKNLSNTLKATNYSQPQLAEKGFNLKNNDLNYTSLPEI